MRRVAYTLLLVVFTTIVAESQFHVPVCGGTQHGTGICYGYAMGRAGGKDPGDGTCNPLTFHPTEEAVNTAYFNYTDDSTLAGLMEFDIVKFDDNVHVSYVREDGVQSPVGYSLVDDFSPGYQHRQEVTLNSTKALFGKWVGYYRRKLIGATVANEYGTGQIIINDVAVDGGSQSIQWWKQYNTFEAINHAFNASGVRQRFTYWSMPHSQTSTEIEIPAAPEAGSVYTAHFDDETTLLVPTYWSLNDALNQAVSGETILVSGAQSLSGYQTLEAGVTLQFVAGSSLTFASGTTRLLIKGHLQIDGTSGSHVTVDGQGYARSGANMAMVVLYQGATASVSYADFKNTGNQLTFWYNTGTSLIDHCTFTNTAYGSYVYPVYSYNSSGSNTIQNSTLQGTNQVGRGIYVLGQGAATTLNSNSITGFNTAVYVSNASPDITDCSIYNNSAYGIYAYNMGSSSLIDGNQIQSSGYGLNITSSSFPEVHSNVIFSNNRNVFISGSSVWFDRPGDGPGNNVIANAGSPLLEAQNYSLVRMGYGWEDGRNSLYDTDFPHLWITNNTVCYADRNYWGPEGPTYYKDGSSTVTANYPLWTDPNDPYPARTLGAPPAKSPQKLTGVNIFLRTASGEGDRLDEVMAKASTGDILSAQEILKEAISDGSPIEAPTALLLYFELAKSSISSESTASDLVQVNKEFDALLNDLRSGAKADLLRPYAMTLLARRHALDGDVATAEQIYSEISADYPGTFHETTALYNRFMYAQETLGDNDEASRFVERMLRDFPEEQLTMQAVSVLEQATGSSPEGQAPGSASVSSDAASDFALGIAVPNPFNPTTSIAFSIPQDSYVRLSVFDLLGREVARLVDGDRPAGSYQVGFAANNLPSGVYIYRLDAGRFSATQKMVLAR